MKKRWTPDYRKDPNDVFLGYANDLDVWLDSEGLVVVVGPKERKLNAGDMNYDAFDIVGNRLMIQEEYTHPDLGVDLHIDLHDMCLIYALCTEHGLFKEK